MAFGLQSDSLTFELDINGNFAQRLLDFEENMRRASRGTNLLDQSVTNLESSLSGFASSLNSVNSGITQMISPITLVTKSLVGFTAALAGVSAAGLGIIIKDFASFETAIKSIDTLLIGTSTNELPQIKDAILDLSTVVPQSAAILAESFFFIQSATQLGAKGLGLLEVAAKGATAGITDANTAADAMTTILNAYGFEVGEATRIMDGLSAAVVKGKITFESLAKNVGNVASIANLTNTSFEDLTGLIAGITKTTGQVEPSITALRAAMFSLLKPTDDQRAAFDSLEVKIRDTDGQVLGFVDVLRQLNKVGVTSGDIIGKLFPQVRAIKAVAAFVKNFDILEESLALTTDAAGVFEEQFEKMMDTLEAQSGILVGNIKKLTLEFGEKLSPIVKEIVKDTIALVQAFQDFDSRGQVTAGIVNSVLLPSFEKIRFSIRALAETLPDVLGALDFTGLKESIETFLGVFDLDLSSQQGWVVFLQRMIDSTESLIEFTKGAVDVFKAMFDILKVGVGAFNSLTDGMKESAGVIGGAAIAYELFGSKAVSMITTLISLAAQVSILNTSIGLMQTVMSSGLISSTALAGGIGGLTKTLVTLRAAFLGAASAAGVLGAALGGIAVGRIIDNYFGISESIRGVRGALLETFGRSFTEIETERLAIYRQALKDTTLTVDELRFAIGDLGLRGTDSIREWREALSFIRGDYDLIDDASKRIFTKQEQFAITTATTALLGSEEDAKKRALDIKAVTTILKDLRQEGVAVADIVAALTESTQLITKAELGKTDALKSVITDALALVRSDEETIRKTLDELAATAGKLTKEEAGAVRLSRAGFQLEEDEEAAFLSAKRKAGTALKDIQAIVDDIQKTINAPIEAEEFTKSVNKIEAILNGYILTATALKKQKVGDIIADALATGAGSEADLFRLKGMQDSINKIIDLQAEYDKIKKRSDKDALAFLQQLKKENQGRKDILSFLAKKELELTEDIGTKREALQERINSQLATELGLKDNLLLKEIESLEINGKLDDASRAQLKALQEVKALKEDIKNISDIDAGDVEGFNAAIEALKDKINELRELEIIDSDTTLAAIQLLDDAISNLEKKRLDAMETRASKATDIVNRQIAEQERELLAFTKQVERKRALVEKALENEIKSEFDKRVALRKKLDALDREAEASRRAALFAFARGEDQPDTVEAFLGAGEKIDFVAVDELIEKIVNDVQAGLDAIKDGTFKLKGEALDVAIETQTQILRDLFTLPFSQATDQAKEEVRAFILELQKVRTEQPTGTEPTALAAAVGASLSDFDIWRKFEENGVASIARLKEELSDAEALEASMKKAFDSSIDAAGKSIQALFDQVYQLKVEITDESGENELAVGAGAIT